MCDETRMNADRNALDSHGYAHHRGKSLHRIEIKHLTNITIVIFQVTINSSVCSAMSRLMQLDFGSTVNARATQRHISFHTDA